MTPSSQGLGEASVKNVVIVGGGTSGWMCAAAIARIAAPSLSVTLVESDEIGVIGVGEATIPTLTEFNEFLGLSENDVLRQCQGTFKLGIDFADWWRKGESYFHPFGFYGRDTPEFAFHQLWLRLKDLAATGAAPSGAAGEISDYNLCTIAAGLGRFSPPAADPDSILATMRHAYHIDSTRYSQVLRRYAEQHGVRRVEGMVVSVAQDAQQGLITSVTLRDGQVLGGDLFVDCSGFKSLLIGGAMGSDFIDWSHYLPCDRALAMPTARTGPPPPFTRATADTAGWRWRIPLQHRTGNGYVYSSAFIDQDEAHRAADRRSQWRGARRLPAAAFSHRASPHILGEELHRDRPCWRLHRTAGINKHPSGANGRPAPRQPVARPGFQRV